MPLPGPTGSEVLALLPEMALVAAVCVALVLPVLPPLRGIFRASNVPMTWLALVGLGAAFLSTLYLLASDRVPDTRVIYGLLAVDRFALSVKVIIYAFTIFVIALWMSTTRERVRTTDGPDYVSLVLSGALGMGLMASASNLLMVFLAIESASFPSYALAGFNKSTRRSSEASLKYVLIGAAASALMVYSLSLLYGTYGTLDIAAIARQAAIGGMTPGLTIGLFGLLVGIGFKLSAVPIHFWCPDVFEGASIEITTFLSVASKAGAIALLTRVLMTIGHHMPAETARGTLVGIGSFVGLVGLITATWGNLAAYFQDNVKRLLAYSSIAQAGYMIMAAALLTAAMGHHQPHDLAYAMLFYLFVYAFMNLGAFSVAAIVARQSGSESLAAFNGLAYRSPVLAFVFGVFLMSLFGMPLTGGFWGKVQFGFQMWNEGMWWLVAGLVVNTVFSLYFYLKPIIVMVWKESPSRVPVAVPVPMLAVLGVATAGVFATGLLPDEAAGWARANATLAFDGVASPALEESQAASDDGPAIHVASTEGGR